MNGDVRDRLSTVDQTGHRIWVYADIVQGVWRQRRKLVAAVLIIFYFAVPWIRIGDHPLFRFDLFHQTLWLLGQHFGFHESFFLLLLFLGLVFLILGLTALGGRAWCGWACPQTVFMEFLYRPIEKWAEGYPTARRLLDQSGWTTNKARRKFIKYLAFCLLSFLVANTFVAYFTGPQLLLHIMSQSPLEHPHLFLLMTVIFAGFLFNFAWFREQMCTIACPYGRFQSVLLDRNSIIVGYDAKRGEPRGKKTGGDCVDCGRCVHVCPTGIDIRNGLQLECVNCAACIDACNIVMTKLKREPNLITYTTENRLAGQKNRSRSLRPIIYFSLSLIFMTLATAKALTRSAIQIVALRAQAARVTVEGKHVRNQLGFLIRNNSLETMPVSIKSLKNDIQVTTAQNPITIGAGEEVQVQVFLTTDEEQLEHGIAHRQLIFETPKEQQLLDIVLFGPSEDK